MIFINMETELLNQIVHSLETWRDPEIVGEEVRAMNDAIEERYSKSLDPIMEALLEIIQTNPNDSDLGSAIRRIYIPLKLQVNGKGNPEGNNNA